MNVFEGKKNTDKHFPVRLVDATDLVTPEPGQVFGDIFCKYGFEAATSELTHTVTTAEWKEQGDGNYWLKIGASEFTSVGKYIVKIECAGCADYNFVVEVRSKTLEELIGTDGVKIDVQQTNNTVTDRTRIGGQLRLTHALAGGNKVEKDHNAANEDVKYHAENDSDVLMTRRRTVVGTVETESIV